MKKTVWLAAALFLTVCLCGCTVGSIDELYSLPQPQEEFSQLQTLIDAEVSAGSEYSAPTAGSQRQSVQLMDIDGDGSNEALAFLKNRSTAPVICIYRVENGQYVPACTITGEGTAIGRVEYYDLDGDGTLEIIVAWKISTDIATVNAYSVRGWNPTVFMSANCRDFLVGNMTGNENPEVMTLNFSDEGGVVNMYSTDSAGETTSVSAQLSSSLTSADRFRYAAIAGGIPALFVEGHYQEDEEVWYLTDIFTASDGRLENITLDSGTGNSSTARKAAVFSLDINNDGVMEVPCSETVFRQPKISSDYYVYDWLSFDGAGNRTLCASTYHCYSDGWFYVIPEEWRDSFTVRRETGKTGERTVVLSTVDESTREVTDRLTIYTLSGENRRYRSKLSGRFILVSGETAIYAAEVNAPADDPLTDEEKNDIISRFHLIYSEWIQGTV